MGGRDSGSGSVLGRGDGDCLGFFGGKFYRDLSEGVVIKTSNDYFSSFFLLDDVLDISDNYNHYN